MFTHIMRIGLLFFLSICGDLFCQNITFIIESTSRQKGLLVIPGLGRLDRMNTVVHNLRLLSKFFSNKSFRGVSLDCIAYIYAERQEENFWRMLNEESIINSFCVLIENPNKLVIENLHNVEPALIHSHYDFVFILLDDCKLLNSTNSFFDLNKVLSLMAYNNLTVASPVVIGANKGGGQKFRKIMQSEKIPGKEGFITVFLELFAWVMTIPAYDIFWKLLTPSINPYGWGYDLWYYNFAVQRLPNHKMGVITSVRAYHDQNLTKAQRTDNTHADQKWRAVRRQEAYFKRFHNVILKGFKPDTNSLISTTSGVAIGYIESPPNVVT